MGGEIEISADPHETALLVVDVQKSYMRRYTNAEELIIRINKKIKEAKDAGVSVLYIQNLGKLGICNSDFDARLSIQSKLIFTKREADAFSNPGLLEELRGRQIRRLILVGVDGNFCVAATAKTGRKLGFQTELLLEAIGVSSPKRFEKTRASLEQHQILLKGRFVL